MSNRSKLLGARAITYGVRAHSHWRSLPVVDYPTDVQRPSTRGDCLPGGSNQERPCPFVSCKWHLAIDVGRKGSLKLNFPDRELHELQATCALDLADKGPVVLEKLGPILNMTRERVRQIESVALRKLPRQPWMTELDTD